MKENLTQPTTAQLEAEVARVSYRSRFGRVLRSTIYALVIVAAVAVLIATPEAALSGAGRPVVRHGRPSGHLRGLP